jgi:hypothetical protein
VPPEPLCPEQIDQRLNWPLGTSARLARRGKLPHYLLPDGSIRFDWKEVVALVRHVPAGLSPQFSSPTSVVPNRSESASMSP